MKADGPRAPRAAQFMVFSVSALVLFAAGSGWLAFYPPVPRDLDGAPDLDAVAERVRIPVAAADSIDAWYLPGRGAADLLVLHGYGRDHTRAWRYAQFLSRAGFGVLAPDFRSSRARRRMPTTLGHHELADAEAALAWVRSRPRRAARIGVLGESLGASVGLVLAARHPEIAAVVADCPFASARRGVEDSIERWARMPRQLAGLACWTGRVLAGCDPCALDVAAAADSLRSRPLFLVHATRDDRFSTAQARDVWLAAGAKDELWLLDVGHNEGWQYHREEYEERVIAFFEKTLEKLDGVETRADADLDGGAASAREPAPASDGRSP